MSTTTTTATDDVIAGFQDLVATVPDVLQPLIIAAAGAVPFVEGEGAALIGVLGGLNPIVAALAGAAGNLICVVLAALLAARIRTALAARRARRPRQVAAQPSLVAVSAAPTSSAPGPVGPAALGTDTAPAVTQSTGRQSKGRQRLSRWLARFGVPGASLLAPLALPTPFTAATLVASGVATRRVILWQAIAIAAWTTAGTLAGTGVLAVLAG